MHAMSQGSRNVRNSLGVAPNCFRSAPETPKHRWASLQIVLEASPKRQNIAGHRSPRVGTKLRERASRHRRATREPQESHKRRRPPSPSALPLPSSAALRVYTTAAAVFFNFLSLAFCLPSCLQNRSRGVLETRKPLWRPYRIAQNGPNAWR